LASLNIFVGATKVAEVEVTDTALMRYLKRPIISNSENLLATIKGCRGEMIFKNWVSRNRRDARIKKDEVAQTGM
jgi:hypothetical protein